MWDRAKEKVERAFMNFYQCCVKPRRGEALIGGKEKQVKGFSAGTWKRTKIKKLCVKTGGKRVNQGFGKTALNKTVKKVQQALKSCGPGGSEREAKEKP